MKYYFLTDFNKTKNRYVLDIYFNMQVNLCFSLQEKKMSVLTPTVVKKVIYLFGLRPIQICP